MKRITNYLIALAVAAFTFTSCEDVPSPFGSIVAPEKGETIVVTPTGTGTEADPYNVAAVLEYLSGLGADTQSDKEVYIKGIVSEVQEVDVTGSYGNATYYISDDADGKANKFMIYRGFGLGGKKFNEGATPVKAGDNVIIKSKVVLYKGNTPETVSNNCIIVELNGVKDGGSSGGDTPSTQTLGTKDAPITVTKALEYVNALADNGTTKEDAYVVGKITKIITAEDKIAQYKNIDYMISDGTNEIEVFRGKNIDNTDFTEAGQINVGDEVVVFGKLTKYVKDTKVQPEIAQGNYIVKLTKGSSGGGSDTPAGDAKAVSIADFNAAAESTEVWYQLTGTVKNLKDGDLYGNFDLVDETGSVYVYGLLSEKGGEKKKFQDLVAAKGIKEGSKITIIGNRGSYNNKIEVLNAYFVSIEDGGSSGGGGSDAGTGADGSTIISVADFNAAAESTDVWYQLTGKIKNLKDGDQYGNFDLEDSTGSVYVYGVLSEKGGAKKKFQDLVTANGIKEGSTITIVGNRGSYNGKIEVLNAYFIKVE